MARSKKLTDEEKDALRAQAESLRAGIGQAARESNLKEQIARAQIGSDQEINASKIGLGDREIGSKDRQTSVAAAIEALSTGAKESIAREGNRNEIASDLAKRGDIDQKTLATALAESGQPGLYNALARSDVDKRETQVNAAIPQLQKDDKGGEASRAKKFKAALDASAGPGAYDEALARAYPDTAGGGGKAPEPKLFEGATSTAANGGTDWAGLASKLLAKGGVADSPTGTSTSAPSRTGYPELPNTPETRYVGAGQGSLEGSKYTDLGGGKSQIATPSGGSIGFNTPQTERRAGLLGSLIGDKNVTASVPAPAGINDLVAPVGAVAPTVASGQPAATAASPQLSQLIQQPTAALPTPTPTPLVSPTGTPVPQSTPNLTPDAIAEALKKYRQAGVSY